MAFRLDDAAPPNVEQALDEFVVQVAAGEGRLDGHGQVRAGEAHDARRPASDGRGQIEGSTAEEIAQDQHAAAVMADRVAKRGGVAVRRVGRLEPDGRDVGNRTADHFGGREQGGRQRPVTGDDDPKRSHSNSPRQTT